MKRDLDLIYRILSTLHAEGTPRDSSMLCIMGYTTECIVEHVRLLNEAGLVAGVRVYSIEHRPKWIELGLTRRGCDFLAAAHADNQCADAAVAQPDVGLFGRPARKHHVNYGELMAQGVPL